MEPGYGCIFPIPYSTISDWNTPWARALVFFFFLGEIFNYNNNMSNLLNLLCLGIVLAAGLPSADQDRISRFMQEGEVNYREALAGEREKLEEAIASFRSVLELQPDNRLAEVLLGGCYALKGQGTRFVFYNLSWGIKGLQLMDNAVRAAPNNYRIRLERAINSLHLNSFYSRAQLAGKDLETVLERSDFAQLPDHIRQQTWLYAGLYYKRESRLDKSLQLWNKTIALDAGSDFARQARTFLAKYKE